LGLRRLNVCGLGLGQATTSNSLGKGKLLGATLGLGVEVLLALGMTVGVAVCVAVLARVAVMDKLGKALGLCVGLELKLGRAVPVLEFCGLGV